MKRVKMVVLIGLAVIGVAKTYIDLYNIRGDYATWWPFAIMVI
jgi:hypothetical protein